MVKYTLSVAFASAFALGTFIFATGCIVDTDMGTEAIVNFNPPDGGTDAPPLCEPEGPCEVAVLDNSNNCVRTPVPGCTTCTTPDGQPGTSRNDGACCGTCWAGKTCYPTPNSAACGAYGGLCAPCLSGSMRCSVDGACMW